MKITARRIANSIIMGVGCLFGAWAFAALLGGLHSVGWSATEFARKGLVASGLVQPIHTMVDFYTHIKGVEYIICVTFFVLFPVFYSLLEQPGKKVGRALSLGDKMKEEKGH